jgi:hypothetical protein
MDIDGIIWLEHIIDKLAENIWLSLMRSSRFWPTLAAFVVSNVAMLRVKISLQRSVKQKEVAT